MPLGWVGDADRGVGQRAEPTRDSPLQRHPETFPELFPQPSAPCWPLPTPSQPSQAAGSAGGGLLCCGSLPAGTNHTEDSSCHRHQPPKFHIKAKRDSPNFRPPRHCLHKSSAYFCIKAVLSKAIQMPEIRDYYDFMSC